MLSTVDAMTPLAEGFCFGEGPRPAIACTLGGPGRRTLFLMSSSDVYPERLVGTRLSRIDALMVGSPGAGLP